MTVEPAALAVAVAGEQERPVVTDEPLAVARPMTSTTIPTGHTSHNARRADVVAIDPIDQPAAIARTAMRLPAWAPASPATDHQPPPQRHELLRAARDRRQPEELRLAVGPEVVVHGRLDEPCAGALEAEHHLDADHAARRRQRLVGEKPPPEQPEVAVGVADVQPEQLRTTWW